jgi:tRNA nucleotidyltransferase (CCA-adding enzyme)
MSPGHFLDLIADIKKSGGRPLLVGGYVRDYLLGVPVKDRDIEVFGLEPGKLISVCRKHGKVMTVGAAFAVLKVALPDQEIIDVSLPRREKRVGDGHKSFEVHADPFMTVEEAARRRDLTINAISMDPVSSEIIDPCNGVSDLKSKVLRHIGPRFSEDPLRVFRIIQFAARFGFAIAPETRALCAEMTEAGMLANLPRERIEEELKKLFLKGRPGQIAPALEKAYEIGIWNQLFPEIHALRGVVQDPQHHSEGDVLVHTFLAVDRAALISERDGAGDDSRHILCLAALLHDLGKASTTKICDDGSVTAYGHEKAGIPVAGAVLSRITANLRIVDPVLALVKTHMRPLHLRLSDQVSDGAIRRLARDVQPSTLIELARLVEADTLASLRADGKPAADAHIFLKSRAAKLGVTAQPPAPILQGRDLFRMAKEGRLPGEFSRGGPHFKILLNSVYEQQLDGKITSLAEAEVCAIDSIRSGRIETGNE